MEILKQLMRQSGVKSFKQLAKTTGLSIGTLRKLRKGRIESMRWGTFVKIAATLQIPTAELLIELKIVESFQNEQLKQEYDRLQQQLVDSQTQANERLIATAIDRLESFLTYYPTAKLAAAERPDFLASKLIPLIAPVEDLIASWGVTAIGEIGDILPYDPQFHQSIEDEIEPGESVKIRYLGYTIGDRLLFRAGVSTAT
jgi:molecular chaperone GrpE (heat shock protein)